MLRLDSSLGIRLLTKPSAMTRKLRKRMNTGRTGIQKKKTESDAGVDAILILSTSRVNLVAA
jgi:hypothetical protein